MVELSSRSLLRGALAGLAGVTAMSLYTRALSALSSGDSNDSGEEEGEGQDDNGGGGALDDIAIGRMRSREGEPATETVARLTHQAVTGEEPEDERRETLGQVVHWGYGTFVGALYGALRDDDADGLDIGGGLGYGAALWLLGDEIAVPALGLAKGPTAHPASMHATTFGAHLVYGAATAAANRALRRIM